MTRQDSNPDQPSGPAGTPKIGVIGDGQLARMMAPAAVELGIELHLLAGSADSSAAQVIPHTTLGDYTDPDAVVAFAADLDVITFDHEHVPAEVLDALTAAGTEMHPGPEALIYAQDKLAMRRAVEQLGLPNPRWAEVRSVEDLLGFGADVGWPVVLKTPRGGYDGKGVRMIDSAEQAAEAQDWFGRAAETGSSLLAEQKVRYTRELSAQVARSAAGETVTYPVVESTQTNGVCDEVIAPAPQTSADHLELCERIARTVAEKLQVTGMLAVELFEISENDADPETGTTAGIYINELAMRPHNSGHWTMDGSVTSQFEQHLRAVLGLPLGATEVKGGAGGYTVMKNLLGSAAGEQRSLHDSFAAAMRRSPGSKIHLYGKEARPGRKIGHVNILTQTLSTQETWEARRVRLQRVRRAAADVAEIIVEGPAQ
ncbi:5-(carboxyamino)imidazole ribonucleotide synthase [Nesterenkonia sp. E16_7]|uniref:5-(carboxyamino)imidazole ribonucleotide synthase n=1 Tax=unclassified Nesterenkonia TaxID=2629769 RepID=UPI001A914200|nr:5-(carboxyamino)imidazole ribonucleotide synthase [Nesterenkonia sp. E16_10]MBO0597285.1 5-(carboxyamino)imidazole ribonucleotide synthase [Nesterenkonia sp. E16_7]